MVFRAVSLATTMLALERLTYLQGPLVLKGFRLGLCEQAWARWELVTLTVERLIYLQGPLVLKDFITVAQGLLGAPARLHCGWEALTRGTVLLGGKSARTPTRSRHVSGWAHT